MKKWYLSSLPTHISIRELSNVNHNPRSLCALHLLQNTYSIYDTPPIAEIVCVKKWEGDCGLCVPNDLIFKKYAESLKKIVGANKNSAD